MSNIAETVEKELQELQQKKTISDKEIADRVLKELIKGDSKWLQKTQYGLKKKQKK